MSTIYYIASKASTSIEKTACAVSGSLLFVILWNFGLDQLFTSEVFKTFRIGDILIGGSYHQVEFLVGTLFGVTILYLFEPVERRLNNKLGEFYQKYIVHSTTYSLNSSISNFIRRLDKDKELSSLDIIDRDFTLMYDEVEPLKEIYKRNVALEYLRFTLLFSFFFLAVYYLKLIFFEGLPFFPQFSPETLGPFTLGAVVLIFLYYLNFNVLKESKLELKRKGLMVFHSYIVYHSENNDSFIDTARSGFWSKLSKTVRSLLRSTQNRLNEVYKPLLSEQPVKDRVTRKNLESIINNYIELAKFCEPITERWISDKNLHWSRLKHDKPMCNLVEFLLDVPKDICNDYKELIDYYNEIKDSIIRFQKEGITLESGFFNLIQVEALEYLKVETLDVPKLSNENLEKYFKDKKEHVLEYFQDFLNVKERKKRCDFVFFHALRILVRISRQYRVNTLLYKRLKETSSLLEEEKNIIGL